MYGYVIRDRQHPNPHSCLTSSKAGGKILRHPPAFHGRPPPVFHHLGSTGLLPLLPLSRTLLFRGRFHIKFLPTGFLMQVSLDCMPLTAQPATVHKTHGNAKIGTTAAQLQITGCHPVRRITILLMKWKFHHPGGNILLWLLPALRSLTAFLPFHPWHGNPEEYPAFGSFHEPGSYKMNLLC